MLESDDESVADGAQPWEQAHREVLQFDLGVEFARQRVNDPFAQDPGVQGNAGRNDDGGDEEQSDKGSEDEPATPAHDGSTA